MVNPKGFIRALIGLFLLAGMFAAALSATLMSAKAGYSQQPLTSTDTPTINNTSTPAFALTPASIIHKRVIDQIVCSQTPSAAYSSLDLIINEIAWSGTVANQSDQWVEIHNPGPCPISLSGWILQAKISGVTQFTINLADSLNPTLDSIEPGGYFVLATGNNEFKSSGIINQADTHLVLLKNFTNPGETLLLIGPHTELVDHANFNGDPWPAGASFGRGTMERSGVVPDVPDDWVTYAGPTTSILDSSSFAVRGTPGQANWAYGVTITPSPVKTPTKKPTRVPPTPFAHVVINEFLPRPGFDWNNDGEINTYDEFIEIENLGPINVNLSGWKLDNVAGGSHFYSLPAKTLKPGERALYYGSVSNIPLLDSGGTVRLLNNRGTVVDARGYGIATEADVSHCRIPDGDGYWKDSCFPTPNTENALTGTEPSLPPAVANKPPACLLPDTVPDVFREAVCKAYGGDILNGDLWDELAGQKIFPVPDQYNKSQTTIE